MRYALMYDSGRRSNLPVSLAFVGKSEQLYLPEDRSCARASQTAYEQVHRKDLANGHVCNAGTVGCFAMAELHSSF